MSGNVTVSIPTAQPTLWDRVITSVAPSYGMRRYQARVAMAFGGQYLGPSGYKAARGDSEALKEWFPGARSADAEALNGLSTIRGRSRDLERNAPIANGAFNTQCTSVVGTGLTPHPRVDREFLGLSRQAADAWEKQAARIWWAWADSEGCDYSRRLPFSAQTYLALRAWLSGGDVFAVRRFKQQKGDILGFKVQLIEADRICNPLAQLNDKTFKDGIEFDKDGVALACHIADGYPEDTYGADLKWARIPFFDEDGEWLVKQIYRPDRPGQTRGIPYLAPVIESLKQLTRYSDAELMAAVISAFFTVFLKSPFEGGLQLPDMGTAAAPATNNVSENVTDVRLGPGAAVQLAPGEDVTFANPSRPNAQFDPFVRAFLNQVGVALELPHELLIKHFTSSYSASRAALLEAWKAFDARRSWLVDRFTQPCYDGVIAEAVARGMLSAPGFFDDVLVRRAWTETQWTGPTMGQLNPLDEANAIEKRVNVGVSTLQEETAALNGGDWERTHAQRAKEHSMRVGAGLEPPVVGVAPSAPQPKQLPDPAAEPDKPALDEAA